MAATIAVSAGVAPAASAELRVRKSVTALTWKEKQQFVDAVLALKKARSPYKTGLSYYDQFVSWHKDLGRCDPKHPMSANAMRGHRGPMFLPWHRQFTLLFENALREVSGKPITVPYWDWTDHESANVVFHEAFMGPGGTAAPDWVVEKGPFGRENGQWILNVTNEGMIGGLSASKYLLRRLGSKASLPTREQVDLAFKATLYDVDPFDDSSDTTRSFRNAMERAERLPVRGAPTFRGCQPDGWNGEIPMNTHGGGVHALIHNWVGGTLERPLRFGTMTAEQTSPNDPVFFLHHSQIDRLWALWQQREDIDTSYKPVSGLPHNSLHSPLVPFKRGNRRLTPADVEDISALGYRYAEPDETFTQAPARTAREAKPAGRGRRARRGKRPRRLSSLLCRVDRH